MGAIACRPPADGWGWKLCAALTSESAAWAAQNALGVTFGVLFVMVQRLHFGLACLAPVFACVALMLVSMDRTLGARIVASGVMVSCAFCGIVVGGCLASLAWLARSSSAFWVLLIILPALILAPLCAARATAVGLGIPICMVISIMLGNLVLFGSFLQILPLQMYWHDIVLGMILAVLASALSSLVGGSLVYVKSAHDECRRAAAALVLDSGAQLSRLASTLINGSSSPLDGDDLDPSPDSMPGEEAPISADQANGRAVGSAAEARLCARLERFASGKETGGSAAPTEIQRQAARLERSLVMAAVEPALPGLCSQPGADVSALQGVKRQMYLLRGAVFALDMVVKGTLAELATSPVFEDISADMHDVLLRALALAAAACAGSSSALAHMPLWGPCSGSRLPWRPVDAAAWSALRAELKQLAGRVTALTNAKVLAEGSAEFVKQIDVAKSRDLLFILPTAVQLLMRAEALDAAVAAALNVPLPVAPATKLLESTGKEGSADDLASAAEGGEVKPAPSAATSPPRSLLDPHIKTCVALLGLYIPAAWLTMVKGAAAVFSKAPATLTSRAELAKALRTPAMRYGLKCWFALTLVNLIGILVLWKGFGPQPENFKKMQTFFFQWVEGSVIKGGLRIIGITLGSLIAYALGLSGSAMNSPFYVAGMIALLIAIISLPYPIAELRYSLGLISLLVPAVLGCAYVGCCNVSTNWHDFAGKATPTVLGALWGMGVTALVLPQYASDGMLALEASCLRGTFAAINSVYVEVMSAATERRPPNLAPQLAAVERNAGQVAGVAALLGASSIDPRLMPLTASMLLPTPPVVRLVLPRLKALGSALLASISAVAQVAWELPPTAASGAATGGPGLQQPMAGGSLVAGQYFASAMAQEAGIKPGLDAVMAAHAELVEAIAENLDVGRRPKVVAALRHRVQDALAAAQEARLSYVRAFPALHGAVVDRQAGISYTVGDFAFFAWLSSLSLCLDELVVLAAAVASLPAQRRDWIGSWLRAWRTTRAQL